ncbi:hypothetical protein ASD31_24045 [Rhizobium sp. Root482]|nr:hypothetical protein ASD31_24045 [Rhizobium sp. Root482]
MLFHRHFGKAALKFLRELPVGRCATAIEYARLGQYECSGAGRIIRLMSPATGLRHSGREM